MQIENGKVVFFHYGLKDDQGNEIENSEGRAPMAILFGHGNIIPGLEKAFAGKSEGDRFDVVVSPAKATASGAKISRSAFRRNIFPTPTI